MQETSPVKLQRRKLIPDAPVYSAEWRVTRDRIEGHLAMQTCERHSTWTTKRLRVTRSTGTRKAGAVVLGAGAILGLVARVSYPEPEKRCDVFGCDYTYPDATTSYALTGTAFVLLLTGVALLVKGGHTKVEQLADTPGEAHGTGPCLTENELAKMLLVLRLEGGRLWPVRLRPTGEVTVLVPEGARVPEDVDLELVVYRAPADAGDLDLARGTVLAKLRLESVPPAPPAPPAAGTASFPDEAP